MCSNHQGIDCRDIIKKRSHEAKKISNDAFPTKGHSFIESRLGLDVDDDQWQINLFIVAEG